MLPDNVPFVRIAVTDTGPGISLEDQRNLFHEFIQVKADKLQNGQGSGLGLWIAANIVRLHQGRIGVLSEGEGRGSTFIIDIPIVDEIVDITQESSLSKHSASSLSSGTSTDEDNHAKRPKIDRLTKSITNLVINTRVLIVDDVHSNRKMVRRILGNKFGEIDDAENGLQALEKYKLAVDVGRPYHVIMMDFMMPVKFLF